MKKGILPVVVVLILAVLACSSGSQGAIPTLARSPYELGRTLYGFFPSPPEATTQSVIDTYTAIGQHADVVLMQQNIPWAEFAQSQDADSQSIKDIHNSLILAHQNGLEVLFVVDPLKGLDRRQFPDLPEGWSPSFGDPHVREAFTNYTLRIVNEFHPRYLGLASEINTYADAHPEDFANYLSLYRSVYEAVKRLEPQTQVFVTFQWEELNNLIPWMPTGKAYDINWDQIEAFEPRLDLWAISSYPFVVYHSSADIPADYYTPLLSHTDKPLAVAEGGYISEQAGAFSGSEESQVEYLNAINSQIGGKRLVFWIFYLLINDIDPAAYVTLMRQIGQSAELDTLSLFKSAGLTTFDRSPKPALAVWDSFRQ